MGFELLRLLLHHSKAELLEVTSRSNKGKKISEVHSALKGFIDDQFVAELSDPEENDIVFVAAPHGASMDIVPGLLETGGCRVIDMSGDYRLRDKDLYEKWYGKRHSDPGNLSKAVYGLTELNREKISKAQLVSNPGCYPTSALLALLPSAQSGAIDGTVIIDSKSGTSGAGISPTPLTHHPYCAESIIPYAVGKHRHTPEIDAVLRAIADKSIGEVSFTPHLVPIVRGIETSIYFHLSENVELNAVMEQYSSFGDANQFIQISDAPPKISSVLGSNYCHLHVTKSTESTMAIFSVIDNLCKGGSGQAVQNMNVMFGIDEGEGLDHPGLGV